MIITERISEVHNEDCMIGMARYPDKYFDLAVVDPEYGIGMDGQKKSVCKNPKHNRKEHKRKDWDSSIPSSEYFAELIRVSKNQIIWGANYFTYYLPPTRAWIFWYKGQNDLTMSDGEMAWTSFKTVTRQIEINRFALNQEGSIHPTQKPIKLYDWIYDRYLPQGGKVIDTHLGSGSNRIAANKAGNIDFVGFELDKDYYEAQEKRWKGFIAQTRLF
jgi:site-specific DNA-methyltransferase (adenine-specific)